MYSIANRLCPCQSGKQYKRCCQIFHRGKLPSNALELMKSRYSAYVLRQYDYIIQTTHTSSEHYLSDWIAWKQQLTSFVDHIKFRSLTIINVELSPLSSFVTFEVKAVKSHQPISWIEQSEFIQENDQWFYLKGKQQ